MRDTSSARRERFRQLCDLARSYRGINQDQLAQWLGRHADRLIPDNANPKMDYLLAMSRALDWPVGLIVAFVEGEDPNRDDEMTEPIAEDFESLQASSRQAHAGRAHREPSRNTVPLLEGGKVRSTAPRMSAVVGPPSSARPLDVASVDFVGRDVQAAQRPPTSAMIMKLGSKHRV